MARAAGANRLGAIEAGIVALGPHLALLARWVRLELQLWHFLLFGWYRTPRVPSGATAFTHHKAAGWSAIASVLVMLVVFEGVVVHVWLSHAGYTGAMWAALAVHVYGLVWLTGDALALRTNRTYVHSGSDGAGPRLELQVGIRARGQFMVSSILEVQSGTWDVAGPGERLVTVSGPANVKVTFDRAVKLAPALGAPVELTTLLLQVDDPRRFELTLAAARSSLQRSDSIVRV